LQNLTLDYICMMEGNSYPLLLLILLDKILLQNLRCGIQVQLC